MSGKPDEKPCCAPGTSCEPTRRDLAKFASLGAAYMLGAANWRPFAGPFGPEDFPIPADKKLAPAWVASLSARGEPTVYSSKRDELKYIGMPVGGAFCGQLYLGGDGRLWWWDIFNQPVDADARNSAGPHYAKPAEQDTSIEQGFTIRWGHAKRSDGVHLDASGKWEIEFRGEYPIGQVSYRRADVPIEVDLEAFSPFVPLAIDDSSLPATVMRYSVRNISSEPVEVVLQGSLECAVARTHGLKGSAQLWTTSTLVGSELVLLEHVAKEREVRAVPRADILFEDFESGTYANWTAFGTAFGSEPVERAKMPKYQGEVNAQGARLVNSHNTRQGEDVRAADGHVGRLTSKAFKVERDFIRMRIGGGAHKGRTCVQLVLGETVVRESSGHNDNRMSLDEWYVGDLAGQQVRIVAVDAETGGWGHIALDEITFTDVPLPWDGGAQAAADDGSLALGLLKPQHPVAFDSDTPDDERGPAHVDKRATRVGSVRCLEDARKLAPGESTDFVFVVAWHFAGLDWDALGFLPDARKLRRHYASRFASAADVVKYVAANFERLAAKTRAWRDTWYDSTLPYWFLERTFAPLSTVATATCLRFQDGRFYGWEGTGCCAGTCTHVWNYAQGLARIFPEIERDQRERIDFGLAFHDDTGAIDYRGEASREVAIDGQAGTILRAYREHTLAPDTQFLKRVWPRVKKALQFLIARDVGRDGILDGPQYNTLDATWWGKIPWISSLYLAALRAGEALAREMDDDAFVAECFTLAERGRDALLEQAFDGQYFVQRIDLAHPEANCTGSGCHIDQLFGQSWAHQVALPRLVKPQYAYSAMRALYRYSFAPDVGAYRKFAEQTLPGGRWYALPGEAGLLMCTWPKGGMQIAKGKGNEAWAAGYFNECMSGFEHQAASHMLWEGLVTEGLAVTRAVHDRYHAARRNPYNEVECGDHYARALASYGTYLAACGFEYHGPRAHIGFAPKLTPDDFRCAFTGAEGWGTFATKLEGAKLRASLAVAHGRLRVRSVALLSGRGTPMLKVLARVGEFRFPASVTQVEKRVLVEFESDVFVDEGFALELELT